MATPPAHYTVVTWQELAEPTPDQRLIRVTVFTIRDSHDTVRQVRIPEVSLTAERAKELLDAEVRRIDALYTLGA
jgi:hypothetical protein